MNVNPSSRFAHLFACVWSLAACAPVAEDSLSSATQAMLPDLRNPPPGIFQPNAGDIFTRSNCTQALWNSGACHLVVVTPYRAPREGRFAQRFPGPWASTLPVGDTRGLVEIGRQPSNPGVTTLRIDTSALRSTWRDACEYQSGRLFPVCHVHFVYNDVGTGPVRETLTIVLAGNPGSSTFPEIQANFTDGLGGTRGAEVYAVHFLNPTQYAQFMFDVPSSGGSAILVKRPNPLGVTVGSRFPAWRAD